VSSREFQASGPWASTRWTRRRVATGCPEEETEDAEVAYARFPKSEPTRYRDEWLPGS
jgi:hypothetical protein